MSNCKTDRILTTCACGDHSFTTLTRGFVVLIDVDLAPLIGIWKWFAKFDGKKRVVAARTQHYYHGLYRKSKTIYLHQVILPLPSGMVVDFKNHNTLDCRRKNLFAATASDDATNRIKKTGTTSKYRGVSYWRGTWRAQVIHRGRIYYLGTFNSEIEAAKAYDDLAIVLHGGQAQLNFAPGPIRHATGAPQVEENETGK